LDRLSFQRFAGLRHSHQTPDRTLLWAFKERLMATQGQRKPVSRREPLTRPARLFFPRPTNSRRQPNPESQATYRSIKVE
jgi:hypothetical protein